MTTLSAFIAAALLTLFAATPDRPDIRLPAVAGQFYPSDSAELSSAVKRHLQSVTPPDIPEGDLVALIVPHAGIVYSGQIAAHGYRLLEGHDIQRVVLCGPSHRIGFHGVSVASPGQVWRTPLGDLVCDRQWCSLAVQQSGVAVIPDAHRSEHSLEVQLPYLQTVLDSFSIVPLALGYQDEQGIDALYQALIEIPWDRRSLLLASTDWQHFYSSAEGWPKDSLGLECILNLDPEALSRHLAGKSVEACGGGPAVAVLKASLDRGANRAVLLAYGDSGDLTGDKSSVVGYAAIALIREPRPPVNEGQEATTTMSGSEYLSVAEQAQLLDLARNSIEHYFQGQSAPEPKVEGLLAEPGAAFVTLEREGRLRGCIGYTQPIEPLYRTISQCAVAAAFNDHRFPPLAAAELDLIDIEISVLTPLERVSSLEEVEVGRDGLMIIHGRSRGLLLPQVATDQGWDRNEFLEATCHKAGLPGDCYQQEATQVFTFQAFIFSEHGK